MKAVVEKLDINKLTNVPTRLNDLKTKVDDLDYGKLKTVSVDLEKLSNVVDNEVVKKNKKFNTLKTKVNNLDKRIAHATALIHINQYNSDKHNLEKKNGDVDKKIPDSGGLVTTTVLNVKVGKVENKTPDSSKYITSQEFNKLTAENFAARLKQADLVNKTDFDN